MANPWASGAWAGSSLWPLTSNGTNVTLGSGQFLAQAGSFAAPAYAFTGGVTQAATGIGYSTTWGLVLSYNNNTASQIAINGGGVTLSSGAAVKWNNTDLTGAVGLDAGLARSAAGAVKVTDGGGGQGRISAIAFDGDAASLSTVIPTSGILRTTNTLWTVRAGGDINIAQFGPSAVQLVMGANGQAPNIRMITELHTLALAGTSDTAMQVPAGALVLGVSARVTTAITSGAGTSWSIGDSTLATRYGSTLAFALNTTNTSAMTTYFVPTAATSIRVTCNGGTFTAGVIRITAYYIDLTAPTS